MRVGAVSVPQTETGWSELVSWLRLAVAGWRCDRTILQIQASLQIYVGPASARPVWAVAGTNKEGKIFEILKILSGKRNSTILSSNTSICSINE